MEDLGLPSQSLVVPNRLYTPGLRPFGSLLARCAWDELKEPHHIQQFGPQNDCTLLPAFDVNM